MRAVQFASDGVARRTPHRAWRLAGLLIAGLAIASAAGQPPGTTQQASGPPATQAASTQPTSAPAEQPNYLSTPKRLVDYFVAALSAARYDDAVGCLDFKLVDPEVAREHGREYATKLGAILERLESLGLLDRATVPDEPDAKAVSFGADPVYVALTRHEDRRWRFSAQTVKDIPALYDDLDQLQRPAEPAGAAPARQEPGERDAQPEQFDWRQSPHALLSGLFVNMIAAREDPAIYQQTLACMDFSVAKVEDFERRVNYLRDLYAILEQLVEAGKLSLDQVPKEFAGESYHLPVDDLEITLKRNADGLWVFSARTVARIPDMKQVLQTAAEQRAKAAGEAAVPKEVAPAVVRSDTSSPRATVNLFLRSVNTGDFDAAAVCLDLSRLTEQERGTARLLAGKLWMVLNRSRFIVPQELPDNSKGPPCTLLIRDEGVIELARVESGPREGEWLFTRSTVRSIEPLYRATEKLPVVPELRGKVSLSFWELPALYVREYWVPNALKQPLGVLFVWQWLGIIVVLVGAAAVRRLSASLLPRVCQRLLSTEGAAMLPDVLRRTLRPISTFVMLLVLWGGLQLLDLGAVALSWIWWALRITLTVVGVYAAFRLIDVFGAYFTGIAAKTRSRLDDVLVPLAQRTAKVAVIAVGMLLFASAVGIHIAPLIAGLGVGGLAFGLAAQDTIKNFFGSVNVVLDRPFQVGDWVKIGDAEGTVESVGLRSSRIRTFYNSEVTIPNSDLMNAVIDNLGRRRYRRTSCHLSVTYSSTPEQLEAFCEGIRELIRKHPYTRKDYYHVYVNRFSASSIDILLYCFHETPDWGTELRERHRLFLDIVRLARRLGVEFAFPTQTIHLHHESSPPEQPPPPPPSLAGDAEEIMQIGRQEADRIVREQFGDQVTKPPPVTF